MRPKRTSILVVAASLLALALLVVGSPQAVAQEEDVEALVDRGQESYLRYCSSCHGEDARGDGVIAPYMKSAPPDLTQINQRHLGEFPFDAVYDIVDGREIPGHGTRTMPVWGPAFLGMEPEADRAIIKEKVVELVYYLKSIQPPLGGDHPKLGGPS